MTNDMNNTFQDLTSACQEIERLKTELAEARDSTRFVLQECNVERGRLKSENARLAAGLEHIAEYWNGSQSESAMYETCEHIRNFASSQSGSAAALHDLLAPTIELLEGESQKASASGWHSRRDRLWAEAARLRAACGEGKEKNP